MLFGAHRYNVYLNESESIYIYAALNKLGQGDDSVLMYVRYVVGCSCLCRLI